MTYTALLFIGATLIILTGTNQVGMFSQVLANQGNYTESRSSLITLKIESWVVKHISSSSSSNSDSDEEYVPPNYGGPDSLYGSGTR